MNQTKRNNKILQAIQEEAARALTSKKAAQDLLIKEGIYTQEG